VSRVRTRDTPGPPEPPILAAPRRNAAIAALTAGLFTAVAEHGLLIHGGTAQAM